MTLSFPPVPRHPDEISRLCGVFGTVLSARDALYVSTPITTGRRLTDGHRRDRAVLDENHPEHNDTLRRLVIEPNRAAARHAVLTLRRTTGRVVIDPTRLPDVPGWIQDDYLDFWGRVIERFAEGVVFADGWQYSRGCVYEFYMGSRTNARLLTAAMAPIGPREGVSLIDEAIAEYGQSGLDPSFLNQVRRSLMLDIAAPIAEQRADSETP